MNRRDILKLAALTGPAAALGISLGPEAFAASGRGQSVRNIENLLAASDNSRRGLANRPTQSAALVYDNNFDGIQAYARPGGLVVAGRHNYGKSVFKNVSAHGGTVLIYLDCIIDNPGGIYHNLLLKESEFGPAVARWPGLPKANRWGYLNDFRVGGILQAKLPHVLKRMVEDNPHMAGWFADDVASKSTFPGFNWNKWRTADQQAYRDGAIALCKTFRRVADEYGLVFMVNGAWGSGYPDPDRHGNALADGGFIENHPLDAYHFNYATSTQWATRSPITQGKPFMYAVNRTTAQRDAWIRSNAVAFAACQPHYGVIPAPYSALHPTGLPHRVRRPGRTSNPLFPHFNVPG